MATLRMAEFGFLGVLVMTCRQDTTAETGPPPRPGPWDLYAIFDRPFRTSWLIVRHFFSNLTLPQRRGNGVGILTRGPSPCNQFFKFIFLFQWVYWRGLWSHFCCKLALQEQVPLKGRKLIWRCALNPGSRRNNMPHNDVFFEAVQRIHAPHCSGICQNTSCVLE